MAQKHQVMTRNEREAAIREAFRLYYEAEIPVKKIIQRLGIGRRTYVRWKQSELWNELYQAMMSSIFGAKT